MSKLRMKGINKVISDSNLYGFDAFILYNYQNKTFCAAPINWFNQLSKYELNVTKVAHDLGLKINAKNIRKLALDFDFNLHLNQHITMIKALYKESGKIVNFADTVEEKYGHEYHLKWEEAMINIKASLEESNSKRDKLICGADIAINRAHNWDKGDLQFNLNLDTATVFVDRFVGQGGCKVYHDPKIVNITKELRKRYGSLTNLTESQLISVAKEYIKYSESVSV